ncbi:MAG: TIGR00266 family protein [Candidatus Acetothermia bacterium]
MDFEIRGDNLQVLEVNLNKGDSMYTEKGGMSWMSENVKMKTDSHGGVMKGLGRMFSGESLFMTTYSAKTDGESVAFSSEFPGKIVHRNLNSGESIIAQRDAFMCAASSVDLQVHLRKKLGAGLFGGEGFIMQNITGPGHVFFELSGEIVEKELKSGETLKVDPGHVGLFESSVDMDIARVKGVKNMFFGGEGLFLATLNGPGKVWLQSMPLMNLAAKLNPYLSTGGE